ncbi:MAG TPA: Gfo/Idh/MocA family oxidoreductase [Pirellulales bacterium]|nr:Gfo/Idh/MocA family oxidoreductase [Pirellulales bacterium]
MTYRIGVIGRTGRGDYGHEVDQAFAGLPDAQIVAVADDDKVGLAAAAKRLGVDAAYADYRELLDKAKPDIVAIGTRWLDMHREMAVAAAERGIHVYMEKPLCRTMAEADEIVAACERTHAKLAVAHPTRYSPKLETVRRLIAEGAIGRVLEYRGRGKEDRRGGGEDMWVLGSHVMDMIRALAGHPKWCFANVTQAGRPVTKADVAEGAEGIGPLAGDAVHAMYGMADGSAAYFASVRNAGGKPSRYALQIYGTAGVLELLEGVLPSLKYLGDPGWSPARGKAKWQDVSSVGIGQDEPLVGPEYQARHLLAVRDLIKAIEDNTQPLCNVYEARGATEMIAAVFESHRQRRPVALPLENRENPLVSGESY